MIIDTATLDPIVENTFEPSLKEVELILGRAAAGRGLTVEEAALLTAATDPDHIARILKASSEVKLKVFGKRVVLFAPLYLSNYCSNGCVYCGFRAANSDTERRALTTDEVVAEARTLEGMGFKRVLLVTGEDGRYGVDYMAASIRAIYEHTGLRIVHINAPPMDADSLAELKNAGAGVYQSFQETYHRPTYERVHPTGRKADYDYRLGVMDRAMEAGFEDVGIGPLLGLYEWRYDILSSIAHSRHLYDAYGTHAHTVSVPRLRPAVGMNMDGLLHDVGDDELKLAVAVLRLALPTAGVVISTRENAELRSSLLHTGATQLSAASRTNPGGYSKADESLEQFTTNDHRGLPEVVSSVISEGYLPSLCTTCYRTGRTGAEFTERTMAGGMAAFCHANAVLTMAEYAEDNAEGERRVEVERVIDSSIESITDPAVKKAVTERVGRIRAGERDLFF